MKSWYLVHTKPRKESLAEENLQRQGFEVYLPFITQQRRRRGRWIDVVEPLFPRYLFVHLELGLDNFAVIPYTKGVSSLVRFTDKPAVVPAEIIAALRQSEDTDSGLHRAAKSVFKPGDKVFIEQGPFAGMQAVFLAEKGADRVIILLSMLGRENRVIVERDLLSTV